MTWNEIVSFICIGLSTVVFSVSLQAKTKQKILIIQLFASILYFLNYAVVIPIIPSATIGAITAVFELIRIVVFSFIDKNEKYNTKKINLIASMSFCVVLTVCTIFAWSGWHSLCPLIGAILVSLALGNKNMVFVKLSYIIQSLLIITYLSFMHLWVNALTQCVVFVFGIVGLITFLNKKNDTCAK